jgi:hypothetical protein
MADNRLRDDTRRFRTWCRGRQHILQRFQSALARSIQHGFWVSSTADCRLDLLSRKVACRRSPGRNRSHFFWAVFFRWRTFWLRQSAREVTPGRSFRGAAHKGVPGTLRCFSASSRLPSTPNRVQTSAPTNLQSGRQAPARSSAAPNSQPSTAPTGHRREFVSPVPQARSTPPARRRASVPPVGTRV